MTAFWIVLECGGLPALWLGLAVCKSGASHHEQRPSTESKLVRRRLNRAADRIVAGDEWQKSLANASLVSNTDATVLRSAQAVGNLQWAFRMLASRKMRLATFRWAIVQQIVFVLLVLSLGFLVFIFAVAMMVPLASLVANLSG